MNSVPPSRAFIDLFCLKDQCLTPHRAGRVLAQWGPVIELELHCQKCRTVVRYETDELPAGYRLYQVRITGEDNPADLAEFRPHPFLEEELAVVASSSQEAHGLADLATSLRFTGHLMRHYIDGVLHLNERF